MIRPTVPEDTDTLIAIAAATGVFKLLEIATLREVLHDFHSEDAEEGHRAVTYEKDGKPIGFVYYAPTPMTEGTWHLFWIFVDKNIQAKGLGARLLKHTEEDIRAAGGRLLIIETSSLPHYELTRRFYLKHGYDQPAVVPDFYAEGDGMVVFTKKLGK
jgi:GNAT superfamily N-acetyltransferase